MSSSAKSINMVRVLHRRDQGKVDKFNNSLEC